MDRGAPPLLPQRPPSIDAYGGGSYGRPSSAGSYASDDSAGEEVLIGCGLPHGMEGDYMMEESFLEAWLRSNTCPDPGIAVRARATISPFGSECSSRASSVGSTSAVRPCPRSPHLSPSRGSSCASRGDLSPPPKVSGGPPRSPSRLASLSPSKTPEVELKATADEVRDYALYLGFDPAHTDLHWIAECALSAPVPEGFQEFVDDDGDIFYYEVNTKKSTYEHPADDYFRWLYGEMSRQSNAARLIQRLYRTRLGMLMSTHRIVRQKVRAIKLPAYRPPTRLEEL